MAIGTSYCIGLWGLKAYIIQVQAFTSNGLPYFSIIGLPDTSLGEARERVKSACTVTGFSWPNTGDSQSLASFFAQVRFVLRPCDRGEHTGFLAGDRPFLPGR